MALKEGEFLGLPALLISTPLATAALSLHGGQLLSFVPKGFEDLLWLSPASRRAPAAIRGGVPVCWPYFGREGQDADVPQHGFARNTRWLLANVTRDSDGAMILELELPESSATPLQLTQRLHIGRELRQSLIPRNTGPRPLAFTQALHSYLRVGDAGRVQVTGLEGLEYADRYDGKLHVQAGPWHLHDPRDPGRSDRTYRDAGHHFVLVDPALGRRIGLTTLGSRSLVVWNPGEAGIGALGDAPADGWRQFVCLETANAGDDVISLAPGQSHTLQQTLRVETLHL
ncbi:MAG: D-hexose-6-phosphate mutarotase [Lysobacteraceae bacterium]|nr:MAG: D-hexose-6-phosphate mutarotase [Xanthomonadaceae bacterium]